MKIQFEDKSYLEIKKSPGGGDKIMVVIQAKDQKNSLKKITNCVEIDLEQFNKIVKELNI